MNLSAADLFLETINALRSRLIWERELDVDGYDRRSPCEPDDVQPQKAPVVSAVNPIPVIFLCDPPPDGSVGTSLTTEMNDLLQRIHTAMGLAAKQIHVVTVTDDADSLRETLRHMAPQLIVTLGERATALLTEPGVSVETKRGTFFSWCGIPVMPTLSLGSVLQNAALKRPVWEHMKRVMSFLSRADRGS